MKSEKLNFLFVADDIAQKLTKQNRVILDLLPTNQKYSGVFENILYDTFGYGFVDSEKEMSYDIPSYYSWMDVCECRDEMLVYHREAVDSDLELESSGFVKTITKGGHACE